MIIGLVVSGQNMANQNYRLFLPGLFHPGLTGHAMSQDHLNRVLLHPSKQTQIVYQQIS